MASIPKASQKRFLRLISAHADMGYAVEAYRVLQHAHSTPADYSLFLSMVVCYCRPFTESRGIGSLLCEYPDYPDWPDSEMNVRHQRMMDIRNKFLGHSSVEGSKVFLLSPGSRHPATGDTMTMYYYAVAKRQFFIRSFRRGCISSLTRYSEDSMKIFEQYQRRLAQLISKKRSFTSLIRAQMLFCGRNQKRPNQAMKLTARRRND